jgi:hypothetical protein
MAEENKLQQLIESFQESNKETKAHLHQVEAHTRNSRRHLLEMKKDVIVMSENIAKMANVEPPKSESEDTEQRREDAKADKEQTDELKKIAAGIAGMKGGPNSGGGGKGGGLKNMLGFGGLGVAAMAAAALKGAAGLVAMGVAIPAFFGGLLAGDAALSWMKEIGADFNFASLKAAALGFSDMIMSMDIKAFTVLGTIMAVSAVGSTKAAKGLAFMGIGISAFLMGLLAGDAVISSVKSMGWTDMKFTGMKTAIEGFSSMIVGLTTEAQVTLGVLLASAAVAGLVSKNPANIAIGMAAMGAGISGFFVGLAAGDAAMSWLSTDFTGISTAIKAFDESIGHLDATSAATLLTLLGAGTLLGKITSKKQQANMVLGIGALSLGIAAFFTGFSGADFVAANVGDGGSIKNLVKNFGDAIGSLEPTSLKALGGLLAVGSVFGAAPGGLMIAGKAAIGMGVIGAGIAAFFVAFDGMAKLGGILGADGSATKTLVNNMVAGIKPLEDMDGEKLAGAAKVLPDIGEGISKFFGAEMMGKLSDTATDIAGFVKNIFGFGDKEGGSKEKSRIERMVEALEPLKDINAAEMKGLSLVLDDLERLGKVRVDRSLGVNIKNFANQLVQAMPSLETAIYGGVVGDGLFMSGTKIRGLANGGTEFELAVSSLRALQDAAAGNEAGGAPGEGAPTIINNYYGGQGNTSQTNIQGGVETTKKGSGAIVSEADGWSNEYLNH